MKVLAKRAGSLVEGVLRRRAKRRRGPARRDGAGILRHRRRRRGYGRNGRPDGPCRRGERGGRRDPNGIRRGGRSGRRNGRCGGGRPGRPARRKRGRRSGHRDRADRGAVRHARRRVGHRACDMVHRERFGQGRKARQRPCGAPYAKRRGVRRDEGRLASARCVARVGLVQSGIRARRGRVGRRGVVSRRD